MIIHIEKSLNLSCLHHQRHSDTFEHFCAQHDKEKSSNMNKELVKSHNQLDHMDLEDDDELLQLQDRLEKQVFDCSVRI